MQGDIASLSAMTTRAALRPLRLLLLGLGALLLLLIIAGAFAFWQLRQPGNSEFLRGRVMGVLTALVGPSGTAELGKAELTFGGVEPVLRLSGLKLAGAGPALQLDEALVHLAPRSLWTLSPEARSVELMRLVVTLPDRQPEHSQPLLAQVAGALGAILQLVDQNQLSSISAPDIEIRRTGAGNGGIVRRGLSLIITREGNGVALVAKDAEFGPLVALTAAVTRQGALRRIEIRSHDGQFAPMVSAWNADGNPFAGRFQLASSVVVDEQGQIAGAEGKIDLSGMTLNLPHDPGGPLPIERMATQWRWAADRGVVHLDDLTIQMAGMAIEARGEVREEPGAQMLRLVLQAKSPVQLPGASQGEPDVMIPEAALEMQIGKRGAYFKLDRFTFADGKGGIGQFSALLDLQGEKRLETDLAAEGFDIRTVLALWPRQTVPPVRSWIRDHVSVGKLGTIRGRTQFAGESFAAMMDAKSLPASSVDFSFTLGNVALRPLKDAPPIVDASFAGKADGMGASLDLHAGRIGEGGAAPIMLKAAKFQFGPFDRYPVQMQARIPLQGGLEAALAFARTPSLKALTGIPERLPRAEGVIDGTIDLTLPLVEQIKEGDIRLDLRADLKQVAISGLPRSERFEAGNLRLTSLSRERTTLLKGEGRLSGTPVQVEYKAEPKAEPSLSIKGVLDDASRARRGLDLRPTLQGNTPFTVQLGLPRGQEPDVKISLDLTPARIESTLPGFSKAPGAPGKISFEPEQEGERVVLDEFSLEFGATSLKGKIELGKDGQFSKADLTSLKFSQGDNARAVIDRTRNGLKLSLRGNAFDLRPFLRGVQAGRVDDGKSMEIDLDLQTTVLIGFNSELIAAAEIQALRRNGMLARLTGRGRFGAEAMSIETLEQRPDSVLLRVNSADAGAMFRFLDIYTRMLGGRFTSDIRVGLNSQQGVVQVRDFRVRGDPLVSQYAGSTGQRSPSGTGVIGAGTADVTFVKLRADFARQPGRLDLKEAVMWGSQVGGSIEGALDYAADRVDLKGALVPAYALNNLFAQLPILGPIFGGSQYEGLFALPFIITGRASAPVLRTNTLSVIAPGFLRKMFELKREGDLEPRSRAAPVR